MLARSSADGPSAHPIQVATRAGNLGCHDDLIAYLPFQPATDDGFGRTVGFRPWWHGIHLGGIDEIDTVCQTEVELRVGICLAGLLAESHRA